MFGRSNNRANRQAFGARLFQTRCEWHNPVDLLTSQA